MYANNNKHSCLIQKTSNGKIEYNTKYGKNCTLLRPITLTDVNNITLNKELELNGACVLNSSDLAYYINTEKIDNKVILSNESYSVKCKTGYTTTDGKEFVYRCNNGELIFDDENSTADSDCILGGCHEYTVPGEYTFKVLEEMEELKFEIKGGSHSHGGGGGLTTGNYKTQGKISLYVVVGGKSSSGGTAGYNGGGSGNCPGGGATHISLSQGLLSNDKVHANVLVVAGGGGGCNGGGNGGGNNNNGEDGIDSNGGDGGTQVSGGASGYLGTVGSKGQGGNCGYYGAGGGGYYGGGGGGQNGGGGSAFCGNGMTNCGGQNGVNRGDGYAKISWGGYSGSCSEVN